MGLKFAHDLDAWEAWSARRQPLVRRVRSAAKSRLAPSKEPAPSLFLTSASDEPTVVGALDVPRGTSLDAVVAPVLGRQVAGAVLTRGPVPAGVVPSGWRTRELMSIEDLPDSVRWVLSAGSYRAVSLPAHAWALRRGVPFGVVQHGALTPFAPPLPAQAHLFAWSEADIDFWRSGRADITGSAMGSQLLWKAAQTPAPQVRDTRPVFLGQLHGTELPKRLVASTSYRFCRDQGAEYRPHPAETDAVSRAIHAFWRRRGVEVAQTARPLREVGRPVVGIFSSGILEAAAQGLPSWCWCPGGPAWLDEFWDRYEMRRWGSNEPTRLTTPAREPAAAIAASLNA